MNYITLSDFIELGNHIAKVSKKRNGMYNKRIKNL